MFIGEPDLMGAPQLEPPALRVFTQAYERA